MAPRSSADHPVSHESDLDRLNGLSGIEGFVRLGRIPL
jgi:hypothetical protein